MLLPLFLVLVHHRHVCHLVHHGTQYALVVHYAGRRSTKVALGRCGGTQCRYCNSRQTDATKCSIAMLHG